VPEISNLYQFQWHASDTGQAWKDFANLAPMQCLHEAQMFIRNVCTKLAAKQRVSISACLQAIQCSLSLLSQQQDNCVVTTGTTAPFNGVCEPCCWQAALNASGIQGLLKAVNIEFPLSHMLMLHDSYMQAWPKVHPREFKLSAREEYSSTDSYLMAARIVNSPMALKAHGDFFCEGNFVVTGGVSGIGRLVCQWAQTAYPHIQMVSLCRKGPKLPTHLQSFTLCTFVKCDVACRDDVFGFSNKHAQIHAPVIKGVVHSSGLLKVKLSDCTFRRVDFIHTLFATIFAHFIDA
jgi:KR domain